MHTSLIAQKRRSLEWLRHLQLRYLTHISIHPTSARFFFAFQLIEQLILSRPLSPAQNNPVSFIRFFT
jgi:hypothetical protein